MISGLLKISFLLLLFFFMYVWSRRRRRGILLRAHQLHHATPPRARSALRAYRQAARDGYVQAYLPMAMLIEHGLPDGPEPLAPNENDAQEFYMQAALWGDARERALATERVGPLIVARVRIQEAARPPPPRPRRVAQLEPVNVETDGRVTARAPSDSQNVHDSVLVRHLRESVARLPVPTEGNLQTLHEVRDFLTGRGAKGGVTTLDEMEKNTIPLTSLNLTESDVLARVWQATKVDGDEEQTSLRQDMLLQRMEESAQEGSCASGRVARVVDALSVFDQRVALKPSWAIRRELLDKAAVLAAEHKGPEPLVDKLRRVFTEEYVQKGLIAAAVLKAELDEWGAHVE